MIIKNVRIEITRNQYSKIESDLHDRCYGKWQGLNVVLYRNIDGGYYIELADHVANIKK